MARERDSCASPARRDDRHLRVIGSILPRVEMGRWRAGGPVSLSPMLVELLGAWKLPFGES